MLLRCGCPRPENLRRSSSPRDPISTTRPPASRGARALQGFKIGGRPISRNHDLSAGVYKGIEGMAELGLGRFSPAGTANRRSRAHQSRRNDSLKAERILCPQSGYEAVHEFFGREIEHFTLAACIAGPGKCLEQMCLASPTPACTYSGLNTDRLTAPAHGDLPRGSVGKRIAAPHDEGLRNSAGDQGEPPSRSWAPEIGAPERRKSAPFGRRSRASRGPAGISAEMFRGCGARIAEERTMSSSREQLQSSACQHASTLSA